jgi:hypothetical protein
MRGFGWGAQVFLVHFARFVAKQMRMAGCG